MRSAVAAAVSALSACFVDERARWALWIPVCLGAGISLYFGLDTEPEAWRIVALLAAAVLLVVGFRRRQVLLIPLYALLFMAIGVGVAQLRTGLVEAPHLHNKLGPVTVEGRVVRLEVLTKGRRIWLDALSIDRLGKSETPEKIRIKIFSKIADLRPGDRIRLQAILHPPAGPAMPGAFDFARRTFFQGLGGVGYAVSRPAMVQRAGSDGFAVWLAALRHGMTVTILDAVPGPAGAIAAALITGERGAIPEDILSAMRESGLAHLLAISGLHMGLVGGLLFFGVRFILATQERLALRYPIKKWAAVAAMFGGLAYLLISGATLPTQRAFLMLTVVMLAVLIDRSAISMNMVAWAAGVILLAAPESLMSVSFQMSFAAVTALVATYELKYAREMTRSGESGVPRRTVRYLAAVMLTTLVAGAATAPFALYHFNQFALLGVAANLLAVPLTALWVMPWAIVAFVLMPFGLSGYALLAMGWGIEAVIRIAVTVQQLPGAVLPLPAMPAWGFALICLGGLWLCLWQRSWRLIGIGPVIIGLAAISVSQTPDIIVSDTGKLVAVKGSNGRLAFETSARGFVADTWRRRNGEGLPTGGADDAAGQKPATSRCDLLGCIVRDRGHVIALVKHEAALAEDCDVATILISRVPVRKWRCTGPRRIIDRFDLWRLGAHALWLAPGDVRVETVAGTSGNRPWSRDPRRPGRR